MKKIIALSLLLVFCLGLLCSCGDYTDEIVGAYKTKSVVYIKNGEKLDESITYIIEKDDKSATFSRNDDNFGEIEKMSLGEWFDGMITGGYGEEGVWKDGFSAELIRKNNKAAWRTKTINGCDFAYILLQKDGSILCVKLEEIDGGAPCFYIAELERID